MNTPQNVLIEVFSDNVQQKFRQTWIIAQVELGVISVYKFEMSIILAKSHPMVLSSYSWLDIM